MISSKKGLGRVTRRICERLRTVACGPDTFPGDPTSSFQVPETQTPPFVRSVHTVVDGLCANLRIADMFNDVMWELRGTPVSGHR